MTYCAGARFPGHQFIHHLEDSARCDDIYNLKPLRDSIEAEAGSDVYSEVLKFSLDPMIRHKADIAVQINYPWIDSELYNALPLWGKVEYHTSYAWDRWITTFPSLGDGVGGRFKVYRKMAKHK